MIVECADPVDTIQASIDEWDTPFVDLDVFGTDRAAEISKLTDEFCLAHLGSAIGGSLFYSTSTGAVHGVELEDGRRVVIKTRPPLQTNPGVPLGRQELEGVIAVMHKLADSGFPCPRPLLSPNPMGHGIATVEEMIEEGELGDGLDPRCRRMIATGLARVFALLRDARGEYGYLTRSSLDKNLYPQPHSKLFDFETTAGGAEWIDDFARRARAADTFEAQPVLGHGDWRIEHLRFSHGQIVAAFDWDSRMLRREVEMVATAAHGFPMDWSGKGIHRYPTDDEIRAFVTDYEEARNRPFGKAERASLFVNIVYSMAYSARCTHSLAPDTSEWPEDTNPYSLQTYGEALLQEARG